jgi:hypothetical protein
MFKNKHNGMTTLKYYKYRLLAALLQENNHVNKCEEMIDLIYIV